MADNPLGLPEDFYDLLPKPQRLNGPIYYLWLFDPQTGHVTVENTDGVPRANQRYHVDLAEDVPHPERVQGYAYPIRGGYRVTDWEHRPVDDPYIVNQVVRTLDHENYKTPENHFSASREAHLCYELSRR